MKLIFFKIRFIETNKGGRVGNALSKAHAVQLQGGSASNMDKYSYSSQAL